MDCLTRHKSEAGVHHVPPADWSFGAEEKSNCGKTWGLVNTFLMDCCVCIQCMILKININNNKYPDWLIYLYSSQMLFDPLLKLLYFT